MRKLLLALLLVIAAACAAPVDGQEASTPRPVTTFKPVMITPSPAPSPTAIVQTIPTPVRKATDPLPKPTAKPKKIVTPVVTRSDAQRYALKRLGRVQYKCLYNLWMRESHWNYRAHNKSSGAYGIPQALPGSKMASAGADWKTNPITQVRWGIKYVNGRYGSACGAWSFFRSNGWY